MFLLDQIIFISGKIQHYPTLCLRLTLFIFSSPSFFSSSFSPSVFLVLFSFSFCSAQKKKSQPNRLNTAFVLPKHHYQNLPEHHISACDPIHRYDTSSRFLPLNSAIPTSHNRRKNRLDRICCNTAYTPSHALHLFSAFRQYGLDRLRRQ